MTPRERAKSMMEEILRTQWTEGFMDGTESPANIILDFVKASGIRITPNQEQSIRESLPGSIEDYMMVKFPKEQDDEDEQQS